MASDAVDAVTVNLWGGNGPARVRMDDLGAWLRREQPDVVLLQEVERLDGTGQAELLAEAVGYQVAAVRTGRGLRTGEGLAVLARHPLAPLPAVRLPTARLDHPRGLQQVDVAMPTGVVRIANTHLAWRLGASAARAEQVRAIVAALPDGDEPVIVGGDLNDVPGSPALEALAEAGFVDCCTRAAAPRSTFDHANPFLWQPELAGRRVDHLLGRGLTLVQAGVVLDGSDGPVVSDHYGVRAVLQRPPPPVKRPPAG